MALSLSHEGDTAILEGDPEETLMLQVEDTNRVLETCFSLRASRVLLYARNVTPRFFDLSSGEAGAILQKLRNYGVQLALVCPTGPIRFSTRFAEMVAEERRGQHFAVFETREAARAWLARGAPLHEA